MKVLRLPEEIIIIKRHKPLTAITNVVPSADC